MMDVRLLLLGMCVLYDVSRRKWRRGESWPQRKRISFVGRLIVETRYTARGLMMMTTQTMTYN
jgi:hypothetical protein